MRCPCCGFEQPSGEMTCSSCAGPLPESALARPSNGRHLSLGSVTSPPRGTRVMARWGSGLWYPGVIDDRHGRVWHVTFTAGDKAWLASERLMPDVVSTLTGSGDPVTR